MVQPSKDTRWGFKRNSDFLTTNTNAFQHNSALPFPSAAKLMARIPNRNIGQFIHHCTAVCFVTGLLNYLSLR